MNQKKFNEVIYNTLRETRNLLDDAITKLDVAKFLCKDECLTEYNIEIKGKNITYTHEFTHAISDIWMSISNTLEELDLLIGDQYDEDDFDVPPLKGE